VARRIVKEPADRLLRDDLKLVGWVQKPDDRRRNYFEWCDEVIARLAAVSGNEGPEDTAIVRAIVPVLQSDDSFTDHIFQKKGATWLRDKDNWDRVREIAAGQVLYEYLVAKEKAQWP